MIPHPGHEVTVVGTRHHLERAQRWCRLQWPDAHGETWASGELDGSVVVTSSLRHGRIYSLSWRFRDPEDAMLFRMAWCGEAGRRGKGQGRQLV